MAFIKKYILPILTLLGLLYASVMWMEADKEIEVLCSVSDGFESTDQLDRLIETAENSRLYYDSDGVYRLRSHQNLRTSECVYQTDGPDLIKVDYYQYFEITNAASYLLMSLFTMLMIFHVLIASGLPFGKIAWGGEHRVLPKKLAKASIVVSILYGLLAILISEIAGLSNLTTLGSGLLETIIISGIAVFFLLLTIVKLFSKSPAERKVMLPVAVMITIAAVIQLLR